MNYTIDVHTHTIACHHAFSTLEENAASAQKNGIELMCFTEHGPAMPYAPPDWFYAELHRIPQYLNNVRIITGVEANISDDLGNMDIDIFKENLFEFIIASIHKHTYLPKKSDNETEAYMNLMARPNIDMLGHIDSPYYKVDYKSVIKKAAETNTLIEFNNGSLVGVRKGGEHNMAEMAKYCKKYGCYVALGSDAHISSSVGIFNGVLNILNELDFPEELIINDKPDLFFNILRKNGKNVLK